MDRGFVIEIAREISRDKASKGKPTRDEPRSRGERLLAAIKSEDAEAIDQILDECSE